MDIDEEEVVVTHEQNLDMKMSNNLDLNVEHDCRSPRASIAKGFRSGCSSRREVLQIGSEFESDEQAYRFYSKYAELVGFSVRKDWVNRSKVHGRVMSRKFTCSRQGHRKKDKRDVNVKKHRKETRTGCLAHMVVTRQPNGKYLVIQFEAEHNHEDVNLSNAQKLLESPLSGNGGSPENSETDSMKNSELQSKLSLQLLGVRFCPPEDFDDLQINNEVYLSSGRIRDMKEGDAARLMYYFQRQHFENPSFFYSLQLDINDKVSNIFWADDNMIVDYGHFGDVICLDTSCTRNTNTRPFVQFIGLNNHRQAVIFGAAFLYDDTVDSLKWLVRTFIQGMSGKKPKFILSDQNATVVQAIHAVLPETSHCICAWQMYLIALKHLCHVKDFDSFAVNFRSCIFSHEEEENFVQAWDNMLERHGLRQNAWLRWMFREKENWAVAYGRNTFFVERNGRHLVELISDKLRSHLDPESDILQFFKHFKDVVNEQRYRELEYTLDMERHTTQLMANSVLLKHPSVTYTPKAFEVFQREYEKSLNVVINKCSERESRCDYKTKTYGKSEEFLVLYNSIDGTVSCNCLRFEHVGILCSHALKVLDHQNVKIVPPYYILKRWTKDARTSTVRESQNYPEGDNKKIVATRYKDLCSNMIKISARAAGSDLAFEFAARQLDEVMQGVERILNFKSFEETKGTCTPDNELVDDHLDRSGFDSQSVDVLNETAERENGAHGKDQLNHCDERIPGASGQPPTETVLSVACAPSTYISSPSPPPSLSPLAQGLYTVEATHMVQSMYQPSNLTINQQPNPSIYEPQNFYSQQHSPSHAQFLQDSLIRNQFQDPMSNVTQLKPVMDDSRHPESSSFIHFNQRYRAAGV